MLLLNIANEVSRHYGFLDCVFKGSGAFKETYCVTDAGGLQRALKLVDRRKINIERAKREVEALSRCNSVHIAKIFNVGSYTSNNVQYDLLFEEFLDGGNLEDRLLIDNFSVAEVVDLTLCLTIALEVLLEHNFVHRDIKPANIMFRRGSNDPVLTDFGIVRDLNAPSITQSWVTQGPGTPLYSSPEQLLNQRNMIDGRSDQFSVGIVMSYCHFGRHPYCDDGMTDSEIVDAVANRQVSKYFAQLAKTNPLAKLIQKMTSPWPVTRFQSLKSLRNDLQLIK